jgi:hypothetical protein
MPNSKRARVHAQARTPVMLCGVQLSVWFGMCVCVCLCVCVFVCATGLSGYSRGTAGTDGVYSSAAMSGRPRVRLRWPLVGRPRGRRRLVAAHDRQRAVGCPICAHDRNQRHRRHLCHRGQQRHRLQRRVGEHRRRCGHARGTRGDSQGVIEGYPWVRSSTKGYEEYSQGTRGVV